MIKKLLCLMGLFGILVTFTFADEKQEAATAFAEYPEALGIYYGEISGTGLAYHKWVDGVGYQVTAGILYMPPESAGNLLDYVIGFENSYTVYSEDFTDWLSGLLSLFWGVNHRGFVRVENVVYDDATYELASYTIGPYTPTFTIGGGIGIEVLGFKHFSVPFEFGYGATLSPLESSVVDMFLVDLYLQAGFRYRY